MRLLDITDLPIPANELEVPDDMPDEEVVRILQDHVDKFASTGGVDPGIGPPTAADKLSRDFPQGGVDAHFFMMDLKGSNLAANPERYAGIGDVERRGELIRMPMSFRKEGYEGDLGGVAEDDGSVVAVKSGAKFGPTSQHDGKPMPFADTIFAHELAHRKRKGLTRALDHLAEWEDHGFSNSPVDLFSIMLDNASDKLGVNFESSNYEDENARAEELLVQLMGIESVLKEGMTLYAATKSAQLDAGVKAIQILRGRHVIERSVAQIRRREADVALLKGDVIKLVR